MLFEPFTCNGYVLHGQCLVCVCMIGVLDCDNQMPVDLKSGLLCFEPYIGFKQSILNELFKDDQVPVEDRFLFKIAKCMHKSTGYIIELFKMCPIRLTS